MANTTRSSKLDGKYNYTNGFIRFDHFFEDASLVLYLRSHEFQELGSDGKPHQPYQEALAAWQRQNAAQTGRRRAVSPAETQRKVDELIAEHLFDPTRSTMDGAPLSKDDFYNELRACYENGTDHIRTLSADVEAIVFNRDSFKIERDSKSSTQAENNSGNLQGGSTSTSV